MYSLMTIDNKTIWYIWKLLREKNPKSSHQKKKKICKFVFYNMWEWLLIRLIAVIIS